MKGMAMASVHDLEAALQMADCVVIATDHDAYDWAHIHRRAQLVVDTRHTSA
jgi:UDP-N-acetyl-D-mannosaminuronate dehydrogenase